MITESSNPIRAVETIERHGKIKEIEFNIGKIKKSNHIIDAVKKVLKEDTRTRYNTKKSRQWLTILVLRELGFKMYVDYSKLHKMPSWETIPRIARKLLNNLNEINIDEYNERRKVLYTQKNR